MSDYEDDLFGDLDLLEPEAPAPAPKVKRSASTGTPVARMIDEAWAFWCEVTERPRQKNPERDFSLTYRKALESEHHDHLMELLDGASRSEPFSTDIRDIRRAISALTTKAGKTRAMTLRKREAPVIPFPKEVEAEPLSTMEDLAVACGIKQKKLESDMPGWIADWTRSDHEAADKLLLEETPEELLELCDSIGDFLMMPILMPSDVLRNRSFARNYLVESANTKNTKSNKSSETYEVGRAEQRNLGAVNFQADSMAERMLQRGVEHDLIVKFHSMAPDGYWDAVVAMFVASEGAMSLDDVYRELNYKYDWHPKSRFQG